MEWVETTARTVDEAKDAALDQLGVDESDAEFEVLEEPKSGLFGLVRGEARVRARVRPTRPRPKVDRRGRRRLETGAGGTSKSDGDDGRARAGANSPNRMKAESGDGPPGTGSRRRRGGRAGGERQPAAAEGGIDVDRDVTAEEQGEIIQGFLEGLVDAFGLDGEVTATTLDEETVEVAVAGEDLGLLIGPKGQTLTAVHELARTVVQRQATGTHHGRVRIDVGGYRQRRRDALERFTRQVADEVKATGAQTALEPMGPADRKVVHDTVNEIDGVATASEGEEPRRRVVIVPD